MSTRPAAASMSDSALDLSVDGVVQGISALRSEVVELKKAKTTLENRVSELLPYVDEVKALQAEQVVLKAAILALMRQAGMLSQRKAAPATFATLPEEIIVQIYRHTVGLVHERDPSILHGANNPWLKELRTKKGLLFLCRSTYWPAMTHLYEDVVLRRFGQISALAHTLRLYPGERGVAELIKGIRIDSCPIWGPSADVVREDLAYLFERCTALRSFSYHPHRQFPLLSSPTQEGHAHGGLFNPTWFFDGSILVQKIASGLRSLDLAIPVNASTFPALVRCLADSPSLEVLTITGLPPFEVLEFSAWEEGSLSGPLKLPHLRELQVLFGSPGYYSTYNEHLLSWELPRLTRLTLYLCTNADPLTLIQRFGSQLTYLHIYPIARDMHESTREVYHSLLEHVFELCPIVEHVVLPHPLYQDFWDYDMQVKVCSSSLKYLDLWIQSRTVPKVPPWFTAATMPREGLRPHPRVYRVLRSDSVAPSLLNTRLLFTHVYDFLHDPQPLKTCSRHPDWPVICGPDLIPKGSREVRFHRFPLCSVMQTAVMLLPFPIKEVYEGHLVRGKWDCWLGDFDSPIKEEIAQLQEYLLAEEKERQSRKDDVAGVSVVGDGEDDDEDSLEYASNDESEEAEDSSGAEVRCDRASVLESFSRSRDSEAYHHVALWDL